MLARLEPTAMPEEQRLALGVLEELGLEACCEHRVLEALTFAFHDARQAAALRKAAVAALGRLAVVATDPKGRRVRRDTKVRRRGEMWEAQAQRLVIPFAGTLMEAVASPDLPDEARCWAAEALENLSFPKGDEQLRWPMTRLLVAELEGRVNPCVVGHLSTAVPAHGYSHEARADETWQDFFQQILRGRWRSRVDAKLDRWMRLSAAMFLDLDWAAILREPAPR